MTILPILPPVAAIRRGLVVDPEGKHRKAMKQAIWLYLYLVLAANPSSGIRLIDPVSVALQMGIPEPTIRSWLGHLRKAGYIRVEREGAHLRVSIRRWKLLAVRPAQHSEAAKTASRNANRVSKRLESRLDGKTLATRLAGDPHDPFWDRTVAEVSPAVVAEALEKVLAVPPERIRKSREALFRYLIRNQSPP